MDIKEGGVNVYILLSRTGIGVFEFREDLLSKTRNLAEPWEVKEADYSEVGKLIGEHFCREDLFQFGYEDFSALPLDKLILRRE